MDTNSKPPTLVTRKEAASFLKSSLKTIDRLIRDGRISGHGILRAVDEEGNKYELRVAN